MSSDRDERYRLGGSSNIFSTPLPDGTWFPEHIEREDDRALVFLQHFDRVRTKDWSKCTFLDLGCNEGTSSFLLAQTGAQVIGIEGREDAVRRAESVRRQLGFNNVQFHAGNVLDAAFWQKVDGVYAAGILYHLGDPLKMIELIGEYCDKCVYFCTHCAPRSATQLTDSKFKDLISNVKVLEFRKQRVLAVEFAEPKFVDEKWQDGTRRDPRSGVGNTVSVWLANNGLSDIMSIVGFPYYEPLSQELERLRFRMVYFRESPSGGPSETVGSLGSFAQPLPPRRSLSETATTARQFDVDFLSRTNAAVSVLGQGPELEAVIGDLQKHGIGNYHVVDLGASPEPTREEVLTRLRQAGGDRAPVYVALADESGKIRPLYDRLVKEDVADYIFTSFVLCLR